MKLHLLSTAAATIGAAALSLCLGCAASTEPTSTTDEAASAAPTTGYFLVDHADQRRCAAPTCGGVFVRMVNLATTRCADGSTASSCHAYATDYSAIGLDDSETAKIDAGFAASQVLVKGQLVVRKDAYGHKVDTLVASEAWVGNALPAAGPTGTFYSLKDNGKTCFAYPCNSITEKALNTSAASTDIAGVDFAASGANSKQVGAAQAALDTTGVLAAGHNVKVTGPGGKSHELETTEFYTKVVHVAADTSCGGFVGKACADSSQYCDMPANACGVADDLGTCVTVPQLCTEVYIPVCGCNGTTYPNDCHRLADRAQKAHDGACAAN